MMLDCIVGSLRIDLSYKEREFKIFNKGELIISVNRFNQLNIYTKSKTSNDYSHFRILKTIWNKVRWKVAQFVLSKNGKLIFGRALRTFEFNNLLLFTIDIEQQNVSIIKQIDLREEPIKWATHQLESKLYKLQDEILYCIDYKRFPDISKYKIFDKVSSFELINFKNVSIMKILQKGKSKVYKVPLKDSPRQVKFHHRYSNTMLIRQELETVTEPADIEQIKTKFLQTRKNRLGIFTLQNTGESHFYHHSFNFYNDKDYHLKLFQILPKKKILRSLASVLSYQEIQFDSPRYVMVTVPKCPQFKRSHYICDLLTCSWNYFCQSSQLTIEGDLILELKEESHCLIHRLKLNPYAKPHYEKFI